MTLSRKKDIYMDRTIAKENNKLTMNARNTTVFFYLV
jgi:hypothetical protein